VRCPTISGMQVALATRLVAFFLLLPVSVAYGNTCVEVPLKPVRRVCGIVNNQLGERILNAKLTLLKEGIELRTIETDSEGRFEFGRIEAGSYELRAQFDGYHIVQFRIVIVRPTTKCGRGLYVTLPLTTCGGGIGKAH